MMWPLWENCSLTSPDPASARTATRCGRPTPAAHPGFNLSNTVETTGAGDTFMGCALHYVLANGWHPYTEEELSGLLRFANAAAAIITTRPGALRVMPKAQEIKALLELTKR